MSEENKEPKSGPVQKDAASSTKTPGELNETDQKQLENQATTQVKATGGMSDPQLQAVKPPSPAEATQKSIEKTTEKPAAAPSGETPPAPAKPVPAAPAKPEAPPPEPGEYGRRLEKAGIPVQHLGKDANGVEMIRLEAADLLRGGNFLRDEGRFDLLVSCSAVDWKSHRESVYHLYSLETHQWLALKVNATERDGKDYSPSLMPVWPAADWHERESFDLMGIHYEGHPNLTRILMPLDWLGYPLRKGYKVDDPRLVWNER